MDKVLLFILIGINSFLIYYLKLWESIVETRSLREVSLSSVVALITLIGLIICCLGMIFKKDAARRWFLLFNGVFLLFGCLMVYYAWFGYIFVTPPLLERIRYVLLPFIVGVVMPLGLFWYFLRPKGKDKTF